MCVDVSDSVFPVWGMGGAGVYPSSDWLRGGNTSRIVHQYVTGHMDTLTHTHPDTHTNTHTSIQSN